MNLILWRHAEASKGAPDKARQLTSRGIEQARDMAAWLRLRSPVDMHILVSPAQRTRQTADALQLEYTVIDALYAAATCESLLQLADWPEGGANVLIVGHQPTLGETASTILTGRAESWEIETAGLWWFQSVPVSGSIRLKAVLSPEVL